MIKDKLKAFTFILALLISITFLGCGVGSDSDDYPIPTGTGSLVVSPTTHDFGRVTIGNSPAPLRIGLLNTGTATINVSSIALTETDTDIYNLNLNPDKNPCGSTPREFAAGDGCMVEVTFTPSSDDVFGNILAVTSDDPDNTVLNVEMSGIGKLIEGITVTINQVEVECPDKVKAYVSVTDLEDYTITDLDENNFTVLENTASIAAYTVEFVEEVSSPVSVALAMDYSRSITREENIVAAMEAGAIEFINHLEEGVDEGEIIKFGTDVIVVEEFTTEKALLEAAILADRDTGNDTKLFDAIYKALEDTASREKDRKAVIVVTDGEDLPGSGNPSEHNEADIITFAQEQGIPIFTIGLGENIDPIVLGNIADETGGQFFDASIPYDMETIYRQLADILLINQYIVTYNTTESGETDLKITVDADLLNIDEADDTTTFDATPECP